MKFKGEILIYNGNPYILISAARAQKLKKGWKKPMPVIIRINSEPKDGWTINMMPIGDGSFYLYLHGDVRKASGTKVGDKVNVEVNFDAKYKNGPQHEMPDWFSSALHKNKAAKKNWGALTPSRQKEVLRYFAALKSDEAKQRNLEKMMSALTGKKTRFMARDWN
jgi:hypothetical protein